MRSIKLITQITGIRRLLLSWADFVRLDTIIRITDPIATTRIGKSK